MSRMFNLDTSLSMKITRLAVQGRPLDVLDQLEPLDLESCRRILPRLERLTIVLDLPNITTMEGTRARVRQEDTLCVNIHALRQVDEVVLQNIYHRDKNVFHREVPGKH